MDNYKGRIKNGFVKGLLTLTKILNTTDDKGYRLCSVVCNCGNEKIIRLNHISCKSSKTNSCGCLKTKIIQNRQTLPIEILTTTRARNDCKKHIYEINKKQNLSLEFSLSDNELLSLVTSNCHYCNQEPIASRRTSNGSKRTLFMNGIDRKNSKQGYNTNNCVSCCWRCNNMKGNIEYSEFINHIKSILKNLKQI